MKNPPPIKRSGEVPFLFLCNKDNVIYLKTIFKIPTKNITINKKSYFLLIFLLV